MCCKTNLVIAGEPWYDFVVRQPRVVVRAEELHGKLPLTVDPRGNGRRQLLREAHLRGPPAVTSNLTVTDEGKQHGGEESG